MLCYVILGVPKATPDRFWWRRQHCSLKLRYTCTRNHDVASKESRSKRPRGQRRGSSKNRLLELRVRNLPVTWMFVSCECCELPGRSLCDGPIPRSEESYRLWCVNACDLEISRLRWSRSALGCSARTGSNKLKSSKRNIYIILQAQCSLPHE